MRVAPSAYGLSPLDDTPNRKKTAGGAGTIAAGYYWPRRTERRRNLEEAIPWCGVRHPPLELSDEMAMAEGRHVLADRAAIRPLRLDSMHVGQPDRERRFPFWRNPDDGGRSIAGTFVDGSTIFEEGREIFPSGSESVDGQAEVLASLATCGGAAAAAAIAVESVVVATGAPFPREMECWTDGPAPPCSSFLPQQHLASVVVEPNDVDKLQSDEAARLARRQAGRVLKQLSTTLPGWWGLK